MHLRLGLRLCALLSSTLFVLFIATSSPAIAAGGVGAKCGGFVGLHCAKGLWCEMRPGSCRVADAFGHCAVRPALLSSHFQAGLRVRRPHLRQRLRAPRRDGQ